MTSNNPATLWSRLLTTLRRTTSSATPAHARSRSAFGLGLALVIAGAIAVAAATLTPLPEMTEQADLLPPTCIVCGDMGGTDVVLNLLLLAPIAAGLTLMGVGPGHVFVIAGLVTLTIETAQVAWVPGRDASLSDLLTNTIGATAAALLVGQRRTLLSPTPRQARRLVATGLVAWIGLEALGAWSLAPSLPPMLYFAQWAPTLPHLDRFTGRVVGAALGGAFLPAGSVKDSEGTRDRLAGGAGPLTLSAVTGAPPDRLAPIVSIFDEHQTEIVLLGQRRQQAFFRLRTRVSDLKLRPPALRIPAAIPAAAGEVIHLTASYAKGRYLLRVATSRGVVERRLDASPNWVWSYLMPFEHYALGPEVYALTALWLGGLLVPIGYWAGKTGARPTMVASLAVVALALLCIPLLAGLPLLHPVEWAAAVTGTGAGALLARSRGRELPGAG